MHGNWLAYSSIAAALALAAPVRAQDPASEAPTEADPGGDALGGADGGAAEASAGRVDGPRFRGGVALTGGGEFVPEADFSTGMFGVDGRTGVQINHLLGIYGAFHLSFGSSGTNFGSGATGTFGAFAMADFTFLDALFAGVGAGYAVFNNPGGPALALRVGGYPIKSAPDDKARRKGLMTSLETRMVFLGDRYKTGYQVMVAVGYEAF